MSDPGRDTFVMADTNVIIYLTKSSPLSTQYDDLRGGRRIAISFQVRAELGGFAESKGWGSRRQQALAELIAACVQVPHSDAASTWYARVNEKQREMRNTAGKGDLWVIAQALEHDCPLMIHDKAAIELARAMGIEVLTVL